jgi:mutator protein MutT
MERYQVTPRTICLIFNDKDQILLLKFSKDKGPLAGYFDSPGGHIEKGEGVIETANREIMEETGLEVTDTRVRGIIHVTNFFGKNVMLFVVSCNSASTEIKESDEGIPYWINLSEIDSNRIFPDMKLIIEEVTKSNDFFSIKSEFDDSGKLILWEVEN